jgi:hypothetical protein
MITEEQLSLFAGDSLVSHSVSPGSNSAQKMTEHSGRKCCESYAKWLPHGSLARMFLESSRWNSTMCYLTWKGKATPAGRLYFQLVPSAPITEETEYGLWRTPAATSGGTPKALLEGQTTRASGHKIQVRLQDQVKMYPTPTAHNSKEGAYPSEYNRNTPTLTSVATQEDNKPPQSGSLNPTWVEWLMGFPIGHTDLKPSETP